MHGLTGGETFAAADDLFSTTSANREISGQGAGHVARRYGGSGSRSAMSENPIVEMTEDLTDERKKDGPMTATKAKRDL